MATERYLLGEMDGPELDEFEEHMFACPECAYAVQTGAAFTENARAVFQEHPELAATVRKAGWDWPEFFRKWLTFPQLATSFAALALLCVVGYQQVEISRLRALRAISEYVLTAAARGPDTQSIPAGPQPVAVELDGLPKECAGGCTALFQGNAVPFRAQDRAAHILLPGAAVKPGDYIIVVQTKTPGGEQQFPFRVQ
jgi:anti-sigma factor RsiW